MWIKLKGLNAPISFDGAEALVPVLKSVLRGWSVTNARNGQGKPRISLTAGPRGFERRSPWIPGDDAKVLLDPVDAVCDLLLDLERAYIEDTSSLLALHAAGVKIGEGVVVFPSTHATGKSLLTAALAHAGMRVFADDQLPIVPGTPAIAVAPGFLPRLRRPLPSDLVQDLADFIRAHPGPMSQQFRYVDLNKKVLAPLGERAPVTGVVLFNREVGAKAKVEPVSEADLLKVCVLQSFGRSLGALEVLDHLHAMIKDAHCVKLTYATAPEAAALLQETYA